MNPRYSDADACSNYPDINECCKDLFGLTVDEADDVPRPEGWDRIDRKAPRDQVVAFEAAGWDVTDDNRRPLRMLGHFSAPLWLAIRGVAGTLPFLPERHPDHGSASLAAEAARFLRNRR